MILRASSISSWVVRREREKRTLARARAAGRPMAVRTWEGSAAPDWQGGAPPGGEAFLGGARAAGRPMAVRTWEGSAAPDWQAEPPLAEMPFRSRAMTRASASR